MFSIKTLGSDITCDPTKFYYYNSNSWDIYCKKSEQTLYGLFDDKDLSDKYDNWGGSKIIWSFFFLLTDWEYDWGLTAIGIDKNGTFYHFCWTNAVLFSLNPEILEKNAKENQKVIKIQALAKGFAKSYEEFENNWITINKFLKEQKKIREDIGQDFVL